MKKRENRMNSVFTGGGGSLLKALLVLSLMTVTPAMADDSAVIDLSNKPIYQPTLDYLHEKGIQIPQKDSTPIPSPGSAYTLTTPATGDNIITKYILNEETNELVPQEYSVNLKQTTYGIGDQVKYFEWSTNDEGQPILKAVDSLTGSGIEYHYNLNSLHEHIDNLSGADYGEVNANFVGNNSTADDGGAIYNVGTIWNITGDFISNSASRYGGAIYNPEDSTIGNITGDFIGNSASCYGGAIYNECNGTIGNITGDFIGNSSSDGGAIYNYDGTIGNITGDFIGNSSSAYGGAIHNEFSTIGNITGDFIGNSSSHGGAIYNNDIGTIGNITGDFIGNSASHYGGGAIYNETSTISNITGDFICNSASSGGAIYNLDRGTIGNITGDFIGNSASHYGGAIYNEYSTIGNITGNFIGNSTSSYASYGGAIYNENSTIGEKDSSGNVIGGIINSSFIANFAKSESNVANGGAIWTSNDLNIIANDGKTSIISGNYVEDKNGRRDEAIYVDLPTTGKSIAYSNVDGESSKKSIYQHESAQVNTLSLIAQDNGSIVIDDEIVGKKVPITEGYYYSDSNVEGGKQYVTFDEGKNVYVKIDTPEPKETFTNKLAIKGDKTGKIVLNNNVKNFDISLTDTNLILGVRDNVLDDNILTLNSGTLNMINNSVGIANLQSFTLAGNANLHVDVDLKGETMDRIIAATYGNHNDNLLTVSGINLLSDTEKNSVSILFAENGLKNNVKNGVASVPHNAQTVYAPIYKYDVNYQIQDDGGYFVFQRASSSSSSNPSAIYNPAVLSSSTTAPAGGQSIINETVRFAFQHADMFSQMPSSARTSYINQNRYAITEGNPKYSNNFENLNKGAWVKPFTSFERINLHNGPDVDAITYGTLIGFDTDFKELKRGWYSVKSGYMGYNGSQLSYKGVDTTLNGGLVGMTETFYKNNFFTALTATAGASVGTTSSMYGHEDFTMLLGGIGSKTGYNLEFKNGKYILQPIMLMNYSFVNTFDYTNAAGVKMDNSPFHTFQINPSVKAVANLENGWQPYASVGFVWNVLNCGKVRANNVVLPQMSVEPYVEYGLGLQRTWKDRFTGFGQAMIRNGGRNGVALTFGFRWALGRDVEEL